MTGNLLPAIGVLVWIAVACVMVALLWVNREHD